MATERTQSKQDYKIPVVEQDSFTLYLEPVEGLLFIHCDVYRWNKTTKIELHKALDCLMKDYNILCALHDIDDNKHRKFLEMYGFNYYSTEKCLDGLCRQVWINQRGNK